MPSAPAPRVRIGCAGLPDGLRWARYWEKLDYIERDTTFVDLPKLAAARRWREASPQGVGTGLIAWQGITHEPGPRGYAHMNTPLSAAQLQQAGGLRDTEVVRQGLERFRAIAEATGAEVVVFRTGASFTPSQTNRDRMRRFFGELATADTFGETRRVWEPQGLWEPETAVALAEELGLILACDPLSNDPIGHDPGFFHQLPSEDAYFRLTGMGNKRKRFPDYELDGLLDLAEQYQRCWFVFANVGGFKDASALRKALDALASTEASDD